MADTKISAETAASALDGTELVLGVQGGANVKITTDQIKARSQTGLATVATSGSAADLSGTLASARLPALSGGDVTSSAGSAVLTIANSAVTLAKMANMATASLIYRKTASSGAPEVNTLATLKTDLGLTGTNSGDQTITLTGDVTGAGTGSFAATLATVNSNTGSFGSASAVPVITVNGKGLITAVSTSALGTAATKNLSVGTSAPGSPSVNDLWVDTN